MIFYRSGSRQAAVLLAIAAIGMFLGFLGLPKWRVQTQIPFDPETFPISQHHELNAIVPEQNC